MFFFRSDNKKKNTFEIPSWQQLTTFNWNFNGGTCLTAHFPRLPNPSIAGGLLATSPRIQKTSVYVPVNVSHRYRFIIRASYRCTLHPPYMGHCMLLFRFAQSGCISAWTASFCDCSLLRSSSGHHGLSVSSAHDNWLHSRRLFRIGHCLVYVPALAGSSY